MTPKAWKNKGYKTYSDNILHQSKSALASRADFSQLTPTIVKMKPIESYYIRNRGYNISVRETWQKMQTWILSNNIENPTQIALLHDNPTITPLADCQYVACVAKPKKQNIQSERLPKFEIAGGVYAKFDFQGQHGDMLRFIHWVYHEWMIQSEYETTTKPSYVIYHKNNFLEEDKRFDVSFYVSITY